MFVFEEKYIIMRVLINLVLLPLVYLNYDLFVLVFLLNIISMVEFRWELCFCWNIWISMFKLLFYHATLHVSGFYHRLAKMCTSGSWFPYRYQNQRHPSNRSAVKGNHHNVGGGGSAVTLGDHMPSQFVGVVGSGGNNYSIKREPLLPTPPSTQMVKLDTNLTCKYNYVYIEWRKTEETSYVLHYWPWLYRHTTALSLVISLKCHKYGNVVILDTIIY